MQLKISENWIGERIYLERNRLGLTLRQLARKTGLSHSYINRIEQGSVVPKETSLAPILKSLKLDLYEDEEKKAMFFSTFDDLYHAIINVDYEEAKKLAEPLKQGLKTFDKMACFKEYYLIMFMVGMHTHDRSINIDKFRETCHLLAPFYNEEQREIYWFEEALYLYINNYQKESYAFLSDKLESFRLPQMLGMAHYLMGGLLQDNYRNFHRALEHFRLSREIFEKETNFYRSNRSKALEQLMYIHMHRFEMFEKLARETFEFANTHNLKDLFNYTTLNMARYHIVKEEYTEALTALETIKSEDTNYYFYKIFVFFALERKMEALYLIQQLNERNPLFFKDIYRLGISAFDYYLRNGDDDIYLSKLKAYADESLARENYMMIRIALALYEQALEKRRRYKEAYEYARKRLNVLNAIMR